MGDIWVKNNTKGYEPISVPKKKRGKRLKDENFIMDKDGFFLPISLEAAEQLVKFERALEQELHTGIAPWKIREAAAIAKEEARIASLSPEQLIKEECEEQEWCRSVTNTEPDA